MSNERSKPAAHESKRPYHLGVAVGLTTGAYAFSLLATSTLQIQHDRALIADREPVEAAISVLGSNHDEMEPRLEAARSRYTEGADGYGALVTRLDALRDRLAKMDRTVADIERDSGSLAAKVPGVPSGVGRPAQGAAGRAVGGQSSGSVSTAPRTVPPAPGPVSKPPVSASTGASGKP